MSRSLILLGSFYSCWNRKRNCILPYVLQKTVWTWILIYRSVWIHCVSLLPEHSGRWMIWEAVNSWFLMVELLIVSIPMVIKRYIAVMSEGWQRSTLTVRWYVHCCTGWIRNRMKHPQRLICVLWRRGWLQTTVWCQWQFCGSFRAFHGKIRPVIVWIFLTASDMTEKREVDVGSDADER